MCIRFPFFLHFCKLHKSKNLILMFDIYFDSESYSSLELSPNPAPQDPMATSFHGTQFYSYPSAAIRQITSPLMDQHNSLPESQSHPQAFQAKVQTLVEHSKVPSHQQAHVEQNQESSSVSS